MCKPCEPKEPQIIINFAVTEPSGTVAYTGAAGPAVKRISETYEGPNSDSVIFKSSSCRRPS